MQRNRDVCFLHLKKKKEQTRQTVCESDPIQDLREKAFNTIIISMLTELRESRCKRRYN